MREEEGKMTRERERERVRADDGEGEDRGKRRDVSRGARVGRSILQEHPLKPASFSSSLSTDSRDWRAAITPPLYLAIVPLQECKGQPGNDCFEIITPFRFNRVKRMKGFRGGNDTL